MSNYIFVDVEARGISPVNGTMTEFGADILAISTYPRHVESRREWDTSGMEFSSEYYPEDSDL